MDKQNILNGWKEIAGYVRLGIRTVQRYEKSLGFPVHRPNSGDGGSVFAFPHEIDGWFANAMLGKPAAIPTADSFQGMAGPLNHESSEEKAAA